MLSMLWNLRGFFHVGVFVHNQWERACIVPVPYRRESMDMTSRVGHLALDTWIRRLFESHTVKWMLLKSNLGFRVNRGLQVS